ncbi:CAAD domain-containing protein [Chamaesiphon sp. GL140_3_metabinner_50]|uniref:CAAD domain-containing protein n=1 Tax=Chamaesiphon sp. GL140_3_metabinner_50 TaxID=2970812 RepID=UPI0025D8FF0A|nr:CAAD domain-containing protein [Chamaesiphon sp. GL140_3_metabinner_50]
MKSDIALHEIMRIDEYEDEHADTDLAAKPTAKEAEIESENSVATQAPPESAPTNSESSISVDIPTDTIINYDEPPTELIDATVAETVMRNDITPSELADMSAVEDIGNDEISTESALSTKPAIDLEQPIPESADLPTAEDSINDETFVKQIGSIPGNAVGFFEEVISSTTEVFKNNRKLLINLGIIFLALIATKLAFAGLSAIDEIPLVSPLLKLVGLFYVGQFVWNYLIRERDRQHLVEQFNSLKSQVLGDRN